MPHTETLTTPTENTYSMEDQWLWYLAGAIDSNATISVQISKDDRLKLGYKIEPNVVYSRPKAVEQAIGMAEEYATENSVKYKIREVENSVRLKINDAESASRFLTPIIEGFVQQRERTEFFLDEVLPVLEKNPQTKTEFLEAVAKFESLQQYPIESHTTKYSWTYFKEKWSDEISQ